MLRLNQLGLKAELRDKYRYSYIGIISKNNITEKCENKELEVNGSTTGWNINYVVSSGGYDSGNVSSITIDGKQYSKNHRGLNIVVYDDEREIIIDKVAFDTCAEDNKAYR